MHVLAISPRTPIPIPQIVISPPDDDGCLLAPLLITKAQTAEALGGINARELQRLVDRRVIDVVHLGPRKADVLVKTESLRRSFGVRVLFMYPEKPRLPTPRGEAGPGQPIDEEA